MRYELYIKIFLATVAVWLVLSFIFGKFEASNDGYNEIGFPFVFYRSFSGKCFDCKEVGFFWKWFFLDIVTILVIAFIIKVVIRKVKAAQ
jgi:hypothetical protein